MNVGFVISKVPGSKPAAYRGRILLNNNGKWRLQGTTDSYARRSNGLQGTASGTGDLSWWNPALGGLGDWQLSKPGVGFSITFASGSGGGNPNASFGITIDYSPKPSEPSPLPNSAPIALMGGTITVR